jgi:hypothetical protein
MIDFSKEELGEIAFAVRQIRNKVRKAKRGPDHIEKANRERLDRCDAVLRKIGKVLS